MLESGTAFRTVSRRLGIGQYPGLVAIVERFRLDNVATPERCQRRKRFFVSNSSGMRVFFFFFFKDPLQSLPGQCQAGVGFNRIEALVGEEMVKGPRSSPEELEAHKRFGIPRYLLK